MLGKEAQKKEQKINESKIKCEKINKKEEENNKKQLQRKQVGLMKWMRNVSCIQVGGKEIMISTPLYLHNYIYNRHTTYIQHKMQSDEMHITPPMGLKIYQTIWYK